MNMKKLLSILLVTSLVLGFSMILLPKTTFSLVVPQLPDEVWVDDDGPDNGYDHFDTIQEGVNAVEDGGTVHVKAGSYEESITISKNLSLIGETGAVIKAPATPEDAKIEESQSYFEYIIGVFGGTYDAGEDKWEGSGTINVSISGFEIDGQNNGTGTSRRFVGVLWRNAIGEFRNCSIHDMYGPTGNGSGEQTFGILVYGDSNVTVAENTIKDFSRGGIGIMGDASCLPDPVATVESNKIYGFDETPSTGWWAENGIQIGYGATGTVKGNEVYNCYVNNPSWAATGILITDTEDVIVDSNYLEGNDQAIGIVDFPSAYGFPWNVYNVNNVLVTNNIIEKNEWGIGISNDARNITVSNNKLLNNTNDAIDVWNYGYGDPSPTDVEIHYNDIYGNGWGLWTDDLQTDTVDATNNYWGANDGPSGDGPGSGDSVVGNVDYTPWLRRVESDTGDALVYITPGGSPAEWRIVIPSKGYDTGWMSFNRFRSSREYMWGYYADKRYKFIFNYYSSGRYHIIFYDRREGISLKLAGRG